VHLPGLARTLARDTAAIAAHFDALRAQQAPPATVRGHGLRPLRHRAGIPAMQLAEHAGVPVSTIYNWEAGRARVPVDRLGPLATALRLEEDRLRALLAGPPPAPLPAPPVPPLRRLRHHAGLTQLQVAARLGVSRRLLGRWERGGRPPLAALRGLAATYGVGVAVVARAAGVRPPAELDPRHWSGQTLPAVLRALRAWSGLTQREVAIRCGCSVDAARAWERGRIRPRPASLHRLEAVYGLAPGSLVSAAAR
jgi:transcriptional regulator with XRE-family HTH domain